MTQTLETYEYAQVLVDLDAKALDRRTFSYRIPEAMASVIDIGTPVSVPFGRMKLLSGYVVGFTHYVEPGIRVKEITDVLDEEPLFDLAYLNFLDWVAQYYAAPLVQVISAALPSGVLHQTRREVLLEPDRLSSYDVFTLPRPAQQVLAFLKERSTLKKGVRVRYVATQTGLPLKLVNQTLYKLRQEGLVRIESSTRGAMREKHVKWIKLSPNPPWEQLTPRQTQVLQQLIQSQTAEAPLSEVLTTLQASSALIQKLHQAGAVEVFEAPLNRDRDPLAFYQNVSAAKEFILNEEQSHAVEQVLSAKAGSEHLLFGVTGSGKTEVYIALTEAMLAENKSVLILVPEISLTSHIAKRFIQRFGMDHIALWHSQLSAGEKSDAWRRIHRGDLKIIIGARSAIFTPAQNLGLIIMDEAHDGSFKQDNPAPRYHAKTLAEELIQRYQAKLVLGSATPDVETFWKARQEKRVLTLTQRYGGRNLAEVSVVDMRESSQRNTITSVMQQALEKTLEAREQAIILLNRRGFYTLLQCNCCGEIFQCGQCSVALTYHRYREKVRCHYCGFEEEKPQYCPHCASFDLTFTGSGTQRLEEDVQKLLPDARILRLDSDVMQKKFAHREVFEAFSQHQADILIGTQMVAKGLDIPNVTLVGVVSADLTFSLPDYKAAERGFQLLTQVAGRSGRGDKPGKVIIQTYYPHHPVIQYARQQDYLGFYEEEIQQRQLSHFPPFSQLFRLIITCPDEFRTLHFAEAMVLNLKQLLAESTLNEVTQLLGPAPCVISRIQGRYRYHVMIKSMGGALVHELITKFYRAVQPPEDLNFLLDVDAQSFL